MRSSNIILWLLKAFAIGVVPFLQNLVPVHAQELNVLVYHRFGEDDVPSTNIRLDQFEAQLDWLVEQGAHFPTLDGVIKAFNDGTALPAFSILITVDDAYKSAAMEAWPRLKARGIPMTLFVATEAVENRRDRYLDWAQLKTLQEEGVTLGFHSHAHGHLAYMEEDTVKADMEVGLALWRKYLGQEPQYFAYPYGEYSAALKAFVGVRFKAAFAQFSGVVSRYSDLHALPRFAINERYGVLGRFKMVATARAMPVLSFEPQDPLILSSMRNPPNVALTFDEEAKGVQNIACYPSHIDGAALVTALSSNLLRIDLEKPLPKGRSRINCTYQYQGEWYWYGQPFFVPGGVLD